MTISSKLPPPLKKESGKQPPKPGSFSKLLEKKQNKLLEKEDKKSQENPIWAPNQMLFPEIKQPGLSDILSAKLSELEPTTNTSTTTMLPVEIEELWEKLASATLLINHSQDKETTFTLETNNTSFFSGMRVTIKEFQTAPKIFNIELAPNSSSALSLIASHAQQLLDRFNRASFDFSIHRIDTELQPYEATDHQKQEADEDDR